MTIQTLINAMATSLSVLNQPVNEDEVKQGLEDNEFLIHCIKADVEPVMTNRYHGVFSFDIIYHEASKTAAYEMGNTVMGLLEIITTSEGKSRGSSMSYRYVNGALHVYVIYEMNLKHNVNPDVLMHTLTIGEEVNNG